jgi:hypothetical protein
MTMQGTLQATSVAGPGQRTRRPRVPVRSQQARQAHHHLTPPCYQASRRAIGKDVKVFDPDSYLYGGLRQDANQDQEVVLPAKWRQTRARMKHTSSAVAGATRGEATRRTRAATSAPFSIRIW